jgi:hypothetical protein
MVTHEGGVGPAGEPPTGFTRVAQSEIVEEVRRQEQAEREWVAGAKGWMLVLRTAPPPVLPDEFRELAQLILDGPSTRCYEYQDGTGATVEFPLWTMELETERLAVVIADRTRDGISNYLYDIQPT